MAKRLRQAGWQSSEYNLSLIEHDGTSSNGSYPERIVAAIEKFMKAIQRVRQFLKNEWGPTTVEYAVLVMLIFLVVLSVIQLIGSNLNSSYQDSSGKLDQAMGS